MAIYLGISNNGSFVSLDDYALQDVNNLYLYAQPESSKWKIMLNNVLYRVNIDLDTKESE